MAEMVASVGLGSF